MGKMMTDKKYMRRALSLAARGAGFVCPNPLVGAVVVKDGEIVGEGWHELFGGPHAEVNAIARAGEQARGADLYVNLEPCNHQGKTPPCTELIIRSGINKVVIGMKDPNPLVNGQGSSLLRQNGIEVHTGIMEKESRKLNEVFIKFITTHLPFVTFKYAMTIDGKIATVDNASRWITGEESRKIVHRLRSSISAVMVGVDTVIFDDPLLNIRLPGKRKISPLKVITDSQLRMPLEAKVLVNDPQLCLIATTEKADIKKILEIRRRGSQVLVCPAKDNRVDLPFLFEQLGKMDIAGVLLEGGSTLAFSALEEGLVDKVIAFVAPKILGGATAPTPVGGMGIPGMEGAINLRDLKVRKVGEDLMIEGYMVGK
ncbi:MAG: bifunctional diaminohydroxyphosphoribosylaminopyrimidine deaminase/5-amino-6-(5-phosphoribosylamino)uracil reductase RibD [Bacteroidetes bacterium]|nr:bifunctional diaminohydroxyphosphoribosylaminopyrimidine deaminase/5-amino-6-(5-phosphoribosylamino)uracil reductase RibD [Bacteroidota bacterium]